MRPILYNSKPIISKVQTQDGIGNTICKIYTHLTHDQGPSYDYYPIGSPMCSMITDHLNTGAIAWLCMESLQETHQGVVQMIHFSSGIAAGGLEYLHSRCRFDMDRASVCLGAGFVIPDSLGHVNGWPARGTGTALRALEYLHVVCG